MWGQQGCSMVLALLSWYILGCPGCKELWGSTGLALAGLGLCTVVLPQPKPFCPELFPSLKQEMEHGFGSCLAPSISSHPRGRCPCLGITSGSPLLPSHAPAWPRRQRRGSWLQSSPACPRVPCAGLWSHHRVLEEEETFQQCLCSLRSGLKSP